MKAAIHVNNISKKYGFQRVVQDFSKEFYSGKIYGISGRNGSGKSTLIKMLSGYLSPSSGIIKYSIQDKAVTRNSIFKHIALSSPYTDIIQEYTTQEMLIFHQKFKPFKKSMDYETFENEIELKGQKLKPIQNFSSGMKQKINLGLNILSNTPILFLDEPTSFLDNHAKEWFKKLLFNHIDDRLVVMASNDNFDLDLCQEIIQI